MVGGVGMLVHYGCCPVDDLLLKNGFGQINWSALLRIKERKHTTS